MISLALTAFASAFVLAQQEAAPVNVSLLRTWEKGEKQAYTLDVSFESDAFEGQAVTGFVAFTLEVQEALENGEARVRSSYEKVSLKFGGEEVPGVELPKEIVAVYGKNGLPKKLALDNPDDPVAMVLPAFYVPAQEVKIGDEFSVRWVSDDGRLELKGTGKLVATGRLYEEHVAMLRYSLTSSGKDIPPGKFEFTSYVNSKTGKLVKAEGSFTAEDPDLGEETGKFVIKKVRNV
jgi:hypothetical protein